jgi:large subunit ribosomal protein L13
MEYTINAKDRTIGRVAAEAATLLRGKNKPTFERNIAPKVKVTIINASLMKIPTKKTLDKYYKHYSGYPGGLKYETLGEVIAKKGIKEVLRRAVYGMLPINKLRPIMIKNLIISE